MLLATSPACRAISKISCVLICFCLCSRTVFSLQILSDIHLKLQDPGPQVVVSISADAFDPVVSNVAQPRYVRMMTDSKGLKYSCSIPGRAIVETSGASQQQLDSSSGQQEGSVSGSGTPDTSADTASEQSAEGKRILETPFELLQAMKGLCLYRQEGKWTYELCYKQQARQFRQTDTSGAAEDFSLGSYTGDEGQREDIQDDSSVSGTHVRFVSHTLEGGSKCVMTGAGRATQVRFTCAADIKDNVILAVKEFPTCRYVFTVATPFLCKHPQFKPQAKDHRGIVCNRLGKDGRPYVSTSDATADQTLDPESKSATSQSLLDQEAHLAASFDRVHYAATTLQASKLKLDEDAAEIRQLHSHDERKKGDGNDAEISQAEGKYIVDTGAEGAMARKVAQSSARSDSVDEEDTLRVEEIVEAIRKAQAGLGHLPLEEQRGALMDVLRSNFPNIDLTLGEDSGADEDGDFMYEDIDVSVPDKISGQYRFGRDGSGDSVRISQKKRKEQVTGDGHDEL